MVVSFVTVQTGILASTVAMLWMSAKTIRYAIIEVRVKTKSMNINETVQKVLQEITVNMI